MAGCAVTGAHSTDAKNCLYCGITCMHTCSFGCIGCGSGTLVGIDGELIGQCRSGCRSAGEVEAVDDCCGGLIEIDDEVPD